MSDLQPQFDQFVGRISLGPTQTNRIDSAVGGLRDYLSKQYDLPTSDIFIQGSCANDTAIKPLKDDDYDVDIVAVCAGDNDTPDEALDEVVSVLEGNGIYAGKIDPPMAACVRLRYADEEIGGFHVDIVSARPSATAPLEVPRREEEWHDSAPAEYTDWCRDRGPSFARTVKALKRWRDEEPGTRDSISSILLQVMVADWMPSEGPDGSRLAATLHGLHSYLSSVVGVPEVPNPVLATEDLASRWELAKCNRFRQYVAHAHEVADRAIRATTDYEACGLWHQLLGRDFPLAEARVAGVQVADRSHAASVESRGWKLGLINGVAISLSAEIFVGHRKLSDYLNNGGVLLPEWNIKFTAQVWPNSEVEIWWQVTNTGGHARDERGLRGKFFKAQARGSQLESDDQRINWEGTAYTGSHLVQVFAVAKGVVVAQSDPFVVNIANPIRQFSL
jgi:hypothetical protein